MPKNLDQIASDTSEHVEITGVWIASERLLEGLTLLKRLPTLAEVVDVDIEFARQLEDAMDLAGFLGVVARRAADYPGGEASSYIASIEAAAPAIAPRCPDGCQFSFCTPA